MKTKKSYPVLPSLREAIDAGIIISGLSMYSEYVDRVRKNDKGDKTEWECDVWNCTLRLNDKSETFEYSMGVGHEGKMPDLVDVLHCLLMDASAIDESFEDFCGNFGYDEDSRKAHKIYQACRTNGQKLIHLIGKDVFDKLRYLEH